MVQGTAKNRRIPLWAALVPVLFLIASLGSTVILYHAPPHQALIASTALVVALAKYLGIPWKQSLEGISNAIEMALPAVLILMMVGILVGLWILGGIVPTLVVYGLEILTPKLFLPAACLSSAVVSLATGSSWSTAGTVGVALMGIGSGLGMPPAMTAGAVISGAYFGDKMSPLSDTTNLAPAVAGTDLFTHVRHMVYTTGPALILALIGYTVLGLMEGSRAAEPSSVGPMLETIHKTFWIHPVLLLAPAAVIAMVILKVPALPALFGGAVLGALFAATTQGANMGTILAAAQSGYHSATSVPAVDKLFSRGGLVPMLETVGLILCALAFGGSMERSGLLGRLTEAVLRLVRGRGSLVGATLASCIGMNIVAGDQYMAIVIPGRMYRPAFRRFGLAPKNLSRCLEDAGTLTSSLVPWNSGGAFMSATLGVATVSYLPFAFLNLLNPVISLIYGITGITMTPLSAQDRLADSESEHTGDKAKAAGAPTLERDSKPPAA